MENISLPPNNEPTPKQRADALLQRLGMRRFDALMRIVDSDISYQNTLLTIDAATARAIMNLEEKVLNAKTHQEVIVYEKALMQARTKHADERLYATEEHFYSVVEHRDKTALNDSDYKEAINIVCDFLKHPRMY